jgi:hypothetical protein
MVNVTVPVAVKPVQVMVAVSVTCCPGGDGLGAEVSAVVVFAVTICCTELDVEVTQFVSPL